MPSATMPTTVATGIRNRRIHGTPPIWRGSAVIRVNFIGLASAHCAKYSRVWPRCWRSNMQPAAQGQKRRLAERFAQGRVDVDGAGDVLEQGAHRQRMRELAGELGDAAPDRLDAEHALVAPARDDADKPAIVAGFEGQRAAAGRQWKPRRRRVLPRRLRRVGREAGADDLRFGEAHRGDRGRIEPAALAGDDLGDHRALRRGLVRQHWLADEVADGPDILHRGAALVVDHDKRVGHLAPLRVEAPALGALPPADGDPYLVVGDSQPLALARRDGEPAFAVEPRYRGAEMQRHPVAVEPAPHRPRQLRVVAWQDAVGHLDHGDLGAELAEGDAQLQTDIAGPNDSEMLRRVGNIQRLG